MRVLLKPTKNASRSLSYLLHAGSRKAGKDTKSLIRFASFRVFSGYPGRDGIFGNMLTIEQQQWE